MIRNSLTVGQLKKLLADVPDNLVVLTPSSDHSYTTVRKNGVAVTTVEVTPDGYFEYFDDENMFVNGSATEALVID
jgi:hypothetical protein